jgi:hypothetical protein
MTLVLPTFLEWLARVAEAYLELENGTVLIGDFLFGPNCKLIERARQKNPP